MTTMKELMTFSIKIHKIIICICFENRMGNSGQLAPWRPLIVTRPTPRGTRLFGASIYAGAEIEAKMKPSKLEKLLKE